MYLKFRQRKPQKISIRTDFPTGTFVHTRRGYYYIAGTDKRYRFLTKRVLDSWAPHRIVEVTESAIGHYRVSSKMKFRNGSLIHSVADGKIYLISEGKRRHIISPDVLERIGASRNDVVSVSLDEIKLHEIGESLN